MKIKNPELLRGLLRETGKTYRELEAEFGIHNSHLANVLAGRRPLSRGAAERVCEHLGVDVDRVFEDSARERSYVPQPYPPETACLGAQIRRRVLISDRHCWLWQGPINNSGYGVMYDADGKHTGVHRVAYENAVGAIPVGMQIDHLCRVRHCVNPAHLEPVTRAENLSRAARARRSTELSVSKTCIPDDRSSSAVA